MASGSTAGGVDLDAKARRTIHTAACLIIGDEVLGGKTVDTNSAFMARWCFGLGIALKKIEVIGDVEDEIIEATRRMSEAYDFVVTSGGIGPTHDDITYPAIAKAYNLPLTEHAETFSRMRALSKSNPQNFSWTEASPALEARKRMIRLPLDTSRSLDTQVHFVKDDLWVPLCVVNGNVHILPGVPRIFTTMLDHFRPQVLKRLSDPEGKGMMRITLATPLPESAMAEYLSSLAERVEPRGVKVGSYPGWGKRANAVTLVGRDRDFMETLVPDLEKAIQGTRVEDVRESDHSSDESDGK